MPIYEYECDKCGHKVEAFQKITDAPIVECERCHSQMKKLISQSTFHLKGTGWYVTDYASKKTHGPGASNETKAASDNKDSSPKKVEAKASSDKAKE